MHENGKTLHLFVSLSKNQEMTYREATEFLFTSLPVFQRVGAAAYKPGLDNTLRLDERLGHPHRRFHTIHVAGTNGKGSVSHMLAAVLQTAGCRTGLYTSPHLLDFRERIRVDGAMIPEAEVIDFVERHRSVADEISPSFFELTMMMAFDWFARQEVDVAVIETGLGGRLDSTNIITPQVSVITNISHDHAQFLGDTLDRIAAEKAGIIKPGVPVVIGETQPETEPVFRKTAAENHAPIVFADRRFPHVSTAQYPLDLPGLYQEKNLKTVLAALEVLNGQGRLPVPESAVKEGLRHAARLTGLLGRWQILRQKPLTVADTGHNEGGIREVVAQIARTPHDKLYVVFGVVNDKDLMKIWPLLPQDAYYLFTQARIERALPAEKLYEQAMEQGFSGELLPTVPEAVERAQTLAQEGDMIFIGGSTFTVAEALAEIIKY
jgi:dihydrofolate synthase/folylpolyglutamate synthase